MFKQIFIRTFKPYLTKSRMDICQLMFEELTSDSIFEWTATGKDEKGLLSKLTLVPPSFNLSLANIQDKNSFLMQGPNRTECKTCQEA